MKVTKTKFEGLLIFSTPKHKDNRGYLREVIIEKNIKQKFKFQIISKSKKNVLRGMHFQLKKPQGKFLSVFKITEDIPIKIIMPKLITNLNFLLNINTKKHPNKNNNKDILLPAKSIDAA